MTPRENFRAMMSGRPYAWTPLELPMTEPIAQEMERRLGHRDVVRAFGVDFRYVGGEFPDDRIRWAEVFRGMGHDYGPDVRIGSEGYAERVPPPDSMGKAWHLTEMLHPLETLETIEELERLPWRDPNDRTPFARLVEQVSRIHADGLVAEYSRECTFFEQAWYTRGMGRLFEDLIDETGIAEWLLDHFTATSITTVEEAARAGVDLIRLGDDVGTQHGMLMSVDLWRATMKPRLRDVVAAAKRARPDDPPWIQYHSDGDVRPILDDLIEIGVDAINPVQPECMPLDDVAARWGDRLAFSGMIGTQTTMPFGSPDDVRAAVERVFGWRERGVRAIIAPTHVLEPDVPWENVQALVRAVRTGIITPV